MLFIVHFERIIVVEQGQIIEDGSHAELLAKRGAYYRLWRHQSDGFIAKDEAELVAL